jgi:hypothetical protein
MAKNSNQPKFFRIHREGAGVKSDVPGGKEPFISRRPQRDVLLDAPGGADLPLAREAPATPARADDA